MCVRKNKCLFLSELDWCLLSRCYLIPFRKRSLPLLTVDAIIRHQIFSHGRCNICFGLSYNKATNKFLNSLRRTKFKPKLNLRQKFGKEIGPPIIHVLWMYQLWKTVNYNVYFNLLLFMFLYAKVFWHNKVVIIINFSELWWTDVVM